MQEINAWLNSDQDFSTGSALYEKYGTNTYFKKVLLSHGATPYNERKLVAELSDLAPATPAVETIDKTKPTIEAAPPDLLRCEDQEITKVVAIPKEYQRYLGLKSELKQCYNQVQRLMAILDLSNDMLILRDAAGQLVRLNDRIVDIYRKIDFYDENGHMPEPAIIDKADKTLQQELQALYVSTSKAETRLKSPTCRDKNKTKLLIAENRKRIEEIKERIAHDID